MSTELEEFEDQIRNALGIHPDKTPKGRLQTALDLIQEVQRTHRFKAGTKPASLDDYFFERDQLNAV